MVIRMLRPLASSSIIGTAPLGPSLRRFANAAVLIETPLAPPHLLKQLKHTERAFGRRRGRRWGARVLDLDILLWSGGRWSSPDLIIPHQQLLQRSVALGPLARIALQPLDPPVALQGVEGAVDVLDAALQRRLTPLVESSGFHVVGADLRE